MKKTHFFSLALLSLVIAFPVQAHNGLQKTFTFQQKGKTWTIKADRIKRKGAMIYFMGNIKAISNKGDKIGAENGELCQTPGKEKFMLNPILTGSLITANPKAK
jgi:hypothetical protein